jgi:4-hydroxybenzoate polyprenyltransferase
MTALAYPAASTRSSSSSTRSSRCPFAYVGAFLAVDGVPSAHDLVWITVAMVGARSLAMGLNRLIDAGLDARNPRTAGASCPPACSRRPQVVVFCVRPRWRSS